MTVPVTYKLVATGNKKQYNQSTCGHGKIDKKYKYFAYCHRQDRTRITFVLWLLSS